MPNQITNIHDTFIKNVVKFEEAIKNLPDDMSERVMTLREQLIFKGIQRGKEEGIAELLQCTVLNAFDNGIKVPVICKITGASEEKIIEILIQNGRIAG